MGRPAFRSQGIHTVFPEHQLSACAWQQNFKDEVLLLGGVPGWALCSVHVRTGAATERAGVRGRG